MHSVDSVLQVGVLKIMGLVLRIGQGEASGEAGGAEGCASKQSVDNAPQVGVLMEQNVSHRRQICMLAP